MSNERTRRRRSGFTLMEVLLVAGILALLAAFAVPKLFETANIAKEDLAKAAIGRNGPIAGALRTYNYHMGRYPDTDEGLAAVFQRADEVDNSNYKGPYLDGSIEELLDPWNHPYEYRSPGEVNEDSFDLWSRGIDGIDDEGKEGSDDIKNWIER